jgi:hypothetical protein
VEENLFLARFDGVVHVTFLRHDCQIEQKERDDNDGYD